MTVPTELAAAFESDIVAREAFEALPPSHRKQDLAWIGEAKRDETRKRRIEKTLEMLREGKAR